LLIKVVLDSRDYNLFHTLLQYHVLNENLELARVLVNLGSADNKNDKNSEKAAVSAYYEPAYQSGLDMLKKLKSYDEIVVALINEGLVIRALNFA